MEALYNLGLVLNMDQKHKDATDVFKVALLLAPCVNPLQIYTRLLPQDKKGHYMLAQVGRNGGNPSQLVSASRIALRLDPTYGDAYAQLVTGGEGGQR